MEGLTLVTGAEGFIGSHLVEGLVLQGRRVRALVYYNFRNSWGWLDTLPSEIMAQVEVFPGDIRDASAMRKAVKGCTTVFHLAALIGIPYSYVAPASYLETNVRGTLNVLQSSLDEGVRLVIHTSTSENYGTAQYTPIDERHPLVAQSPYSASKIAADKLAESFHLSFGLPVATIRPFNTYGPRQSNRAVIPTIVTQALSGIDVIQLGALTPVRDLTYVKDTVRAFLLLAESNNNIGRVTNVGSGKGITIGDLTGLILELCGSDAEIVVDKQRVRPETSEVQKLICNNTWAAESLGWQPQYSLRQGLGETIAWIRANLEHYKTANYTV
jgi:NAD dependent epimerase/dehydratase